MSFKTYWCRNGRAAMLLGGSPSKRRNVVSPTRWHNLYSPRMDSLSFVFSAEEKFTRTRRAPENVSSPKINGVELIVAL